MARAGEILANNRSECWKTCNLVAIFVMNIACIMAVSTAFALPTNKPVSNQSMELANLRQVAIIIRHGERSPIIFYPNDPHLTYPWPGGPDSLTKKGMLQMYTLGQQLRRMYGSLISENYQSQDLLVKSPDAERNIMSAQALLAGLYRPKPEDQFVPGLPWRPVPVQTLPKGMDKLMMSLLAAPCPRLTRETTKIHSEIIAKYDNLLSPSLYAELSRLTGLRIVSLQDVMFLYNILDVEALHGLPLPVWAEAYYKNQTIIDLGMECFLSYGSSLVQKRLRSGPLLAEILKNMWKRRNGTDERKMYIYSTGDIAVLNLMRTIGFTEESSVPEHGAALIFELHTVEDGQNHEMKILYLNNSETTVPHALDVPGCGKSCSLETLSKTLKPILPENWDEECKT